MGYVVKKLPNKKSIPKWKVQFSSRKKEHIKNSNVKYPSRAWDIPKYKWSGLGFSKLMTLEEAKLRCSQLNLLKEAKRKEEIRIKHKERLKTFEDEVALFLPQHYKDEFEQRYFYNLRKKRATQNKELCHWRTAQKLILDIRCEPVDWFERCFEIYDWLSDKKYSPNYFRKILNVLNLWGFFISKKMDRPFLPIPRPRGMELSRMKEAFFSKNEPSKASEPIFPERLEEVKHHFKKEQYNWLYLSVWFGLRPKEVDNLKVNSKVMMDKEGCAVLWVYQTKITSVPKSHRWKPIPVLFPEQERALSILENECFTRPLVKTVRKYIGKNCSLYGGRKGFTDLMLAKKQKFHNVSQWMGHSTIERTWKHYKDKNQVHYDKAG